MIIDDWTTKYKKKIIEDLDVFTIPKGTILYRGINIKFIKRKTSQHIFLSTLPVATIYGYSSDYGGNKQMGCVVGYKLPKDIHLLNMESECNYRIIRKNSKIPPALHKQYKDILHEAFNDGKNRYSHEEVDNIIVKWFCRFIKTKKMLKDGNHIISGYAYTSLMNNHNEVMICNKYIDYNNPDVIYRALPYMDINIKNNVLIDDKKYKLYETIKGKYTGNNMKIDDLKYEISPGNYIFVKNVLNDLYINNVKYVEDIPYGSDLDFDKVIQRNKDIDAFLFEGVFKKKRDEYVKHIFEFSQMHLKSTFTKTYANLLRTKKKKPD